MTADTLKSASITNLDTLGTGGGPVENSTGVGAPYSVKNISDYVTPTTGGLASTSSTYKMVRVPTNVQLQHVNLFADGALDSNATPTLAIDIGVYYSDSTVDGTPAANQGAAVSDNAIADAFPLKGQTGVFAAEAGKWSSANRQLPLWQALALTTDPGGYFDIVITIETVAATAVSVALMLEAVYNIPG